MEEASDVGALVSKKEYPRLLDQLLCSGGIDSPHRIVVTAELVRFVGCPAALLLGQILYWWARIDPSVGFYKSDVDWEKELGLKRGRIMAARELLEAMNIIHLKVKKADGAPTNHYKVDFEALKRQFSTFSRVSSKEWEQILKMYKPGSGKRQASAAHTAA